MEEPGGKSYKVSGPDHMLQCIRQMESGGAQQQGVQQTTGAAKQQQQAAAEAPMGI